MIARLRSLLALTCLVALSGTAALAQGQWIDLFNGYDLSGWSVGGTPWVVQSGVMTNTQGYETDWIRYDRLLPSDEFIFEMTVRMVSGMRLRTHMAFDSVYIGNEGFTRQFEIYGGDATQVSQVGDDSYSTGQWYTLRLVVQPTDQMKLYKDGVLTHTATRSRVLPTQVAILPGDHWSPGKVEISSIRYCTVPEPSSLLTLLCGLGGIGGIVWRVRR